jgi:O-antigen ligase
VDAAPANRVLEAGLIASVWSAALGIGGTETFTFAAVQFALFALLAVLLWMGSRWQLPWRVPLLLAVWVAMQWGLLVGDGYSARAHLPRLVAYLAAFLIAAHLSATRRVRARLAAAIVLLALVEAAMGLAQYLAGWQQIYHLQKVFYTAHASGTYVNPNHFAGLLAMALPLALAAALGGWERYARGARESEDRETSPARAALLSFLTALLFVAVLYSRSRGGLLAATAGLVATGAVWLAASRRRREAALAVGVFLAAAAALGAWVGLEPVVERYETTGRDLVARTAVWRDTLALVAERPLAGAGFGSFGEVYPRVQTAHLEFTVDHAHNDYLQMAAELGVPAAALLAASWIFLVRRGLRAALTDSATTSQRVFSAGSAGGVVALLAHAFLDFNLQLPANALVFAVLLGMLAARPGGEPVHQFSPGVPAARP